ncbi:hypothetical protein TEU_02130 [Thermococcus eurythermalis]|uniref:Uncharacterized protein n=1 Tax=Thermococcus eurythermalis TaxID=1505907 RepID=A0A097QRZ5_9EURY|nr:hypothetical protein [Thermococcus eurythermalis]AIU69233.1 hypothetical protein TEU_02130 [Thermococcus eurythermalis]
MGWKRFLAVALVVLFLGMALRGASAAASFVNATANGTVKVPQEFSPEKGPGGEVQPQFGGATVVVEPFLEVFVPGIGWIVAIGSIVAAIAKYVYSKPVSEFTEAFVSEIPDKIKDGNQELAKGVKMNFWGSKAEIGYGYVKKKWWGLKKEAVIVKPIITITRDEVKAVEDLFSPKEYGKLLAQAYLNGWDANKAKKLAKEFDKQYKNFRVKFRGRYACGSYFPEGDVIIEKGNDKYGAVHFIKRHILRQRLGKKGKLTVFPSDWSADFILSLIGETIKKGRIDCSDPEHTPRKFVVEKRFGYFRGKWIGRKVRVVLSYDRARGIYKFITAYLD